VSFRPENGERGGASGGPPGGPDSERLRAPLGGQEERRRGRSTSRRPFVPVVVGILLLALVIGLLILWSSYGDRAGGTSVYEDSIESGTEPMIHITNGPGRVRIEGVEGLETVEISAKRYARGRNPTAAKSNASGVPVDIANDGSTLEISSDGGGGTGVDYDLRVPPGATVEIESVAGDVEISGLDNDATARVESGDVSMEDVQGSIAIEAPQGDVTVKSISTETGNVDITVGSGDLDLENLVVGIMEARVDSGDVTLLGRFSGSGRVFVETGSINVRLPSEDTNDLTFETRVGEVVRDDEQESG
jgi:hypothetical protein